MRNKNTGQQDAPDRKQRNISPFDRVILDSMSAHIAILDRHGIILETNRAWRRFGMENGMRDDPETLHLNYLEICDAASGDDAVYSRNAADGIRSILAGEKDSYTMDYPCHSPTEQMWFYLRVTRIENAAPFRVIVSHENITPIKLAEETIRKHEEELKIKTESLEESNTALKVLLRQRESDKKELEEKVVSNIQQRVIRYVEKLQSTRLDKRQQTYLELIDTNLKDIVSPFLHKIAALNLHLTPQEIQVAELVKVGKSTKEISDILNISTNAVDFHRKNIRKKFGLSHSKTNLRTFLLSLS